MYRLVAGALAVILAFSMGTALGANENLTLVLDARPTNIAPCGVAGVCDGVDPATQVAPKESFYFSMLVRNIDTELDAVSCAFDWDPSWNFVASAWSCAGGNTGEVSPYGPGPMEGSLVVTFDCIPAGSTVVAGWLLMSSGHQGCLEIIESTFFPICGLASTACWQPDCTPIDPRNVGRVCVGPGGYAPCEPVAVPVEAASWGRIKGQLQERWSPH